jgi:hypothetical protein
MALMSVLNNMLPHWSTVLLVLLLGILYVSINLIRGVSVETLLAVKRLIVQGTVFAASFVQKGARKLDYVSCTLYVG